MVDLDTSYLARRSLLLDLTILVRTLGVVVSRKGAG
jgi:lipopolysaccharide/colanic/teichoic acid biosynthesis glycosyltransferase